MVRLIINIIPAVAFVAFLILIFGIFIILGAGIKGLLYIYYSDLERYDKTRLVPCMVMIVLVFIFGIFLIPCDIFYCVMVVSEISYSLIGRKTSCLLIVINFIYFALLLAVLCIMAYGLATVNTRLCVLPVLGFPFRQIVILGQQRENIIAKNVDRIDKALHVLELLDGYHFENVSVFESEVGYIKTFVTTTSSARSMQLYSVRTTVTVTTTAINTFWNYAPDENGTVELRDTAKEMEEKMSDVCEDGIYAFLIGTVHTCFAILAIIIIIICLTGYYTMFHHIYKMETKHDRDVQDDAHATVAPCDEPCPCVDPI